MVLLLNLVPIYSFLSDNICEEYLGIEIINCGSFESSVCIIYQTFYTDYNYVDMFAGQLLLTCKNYINCNQNM